MKRSFLTTIGVVAVMALVVPDASAAMVLTLDDAFTAGVEVTVVDNGVGDLNMTIGQIVYMGAVNAWNVNVATGLGQPLTGPLPEIDLNAICMSTSIAGNLGPHSMQVALTDTNFPFLPNPPHTVYNGIGGTTDGSVVSAWCADAANAPFGIGVPFGTIGPFFGTPPTGLFGGSGTIGVFMPVGLFSMSNWVTINHTGGPVGTSETTSFDSVVIIPAPGAVVLGVIGLGLVGRMKRWLS